MLLVVAKTSPPYAIHPRGGGDIGAGMNYQVMLLSIFNTTLESLITVSILAVVVLRALYPDRSGTLEQNTIILSVLIILIRIRHWGNRRRSVGNDILYAGARSLL
uniref:Uncharacterized protein n=1 Tax=Anopheles culicifacies TaxID=139723 RepID=A0A182M379_9DIPT